METTKLTRILSLTAAATFVVATGAAGYLTIGLPPVVIVGGSGLVAMVLWSRTYLKRPVDPEIVLPVFLLTVAALEVHMAEEYLTGFGPAMSRLFDIGWTERSFLMVFAFIGPGVAEFTHFIFPILQPAIHPELPASLSQAVSNGVYVADMPNYYFQTTGVYYFPGLYTAILPMIPGIWAIRRLLRASADRARGSVRRSAEDHVGAFAE